MDVNQNKILVKKWLSVSKHSTFLYSTSRQDKPFKRELGNIFHKPFKFVFIYFLYQNSTRIVHKGSMFADNEPLYHHINIHVYLKRRRLYTLLLTSAFITMYKYTGTWANMLTCTRHLYFVLEWLNSTQIMSTVFTPGADREHIFKYVQLLLNAILITQFKINYGRYH